MVEEGIDEKQKTDYSECVAKYVSLVTDSFNTIKPPKVLISNNINTIPY